MRKKGVSLAFNTIIVAAIALVVLVVVLAIYTGFIKKSSSELEKPVDAAGLKASDSAWCLTELLKGKQCQELDSAACSGDCETAGLDKSSGTCQLVCKGDKQKHAIAKKSTDSSYDCEKNDPAARYCCCT